MLKYILIFLLVFSSSLYSEDNTGDSINKVVSQFLINLKQNNMAEIKKLLHEEIQLKDISIDQIYQLGEKMLKEEIQVSEYLINVTGHNIQNMVSPDHKILGFEIKEKAQMEWISKDIDKNFGKLYYVKAEIVFKMKDKIMKKICEIDVLQRDGFKDYKILGFIQQS